MASYFNPQGSREPRLEYLLDCLEQCPISIHKALASLDALESLSVFELIISIHKALASLDVTAEHKILVKNDFNPQGSREPRPSLYKKYDSRV